MLFVVPGIDKTLRVNGRLLVSTHGSEWQLCQEGPPPQKRVTRVAVKSGCWHCAKAFMCPDLCDPTSQVDHAAVMPGMGEMLRDPLREFHGAEAHTRTRSETAERDPNAL
ncbi:hypothetical protein [Hydrogenophaga crassostreae]|uniref:hypothetical protein n=1 Tax=Hydrogenophaga crassostreae TaxID=1763535 RepID=UPI000B2C3BDE|nr:hypothetical protein [Hydrogenophaga crassostreae]